MGKRAVLVEAGKVIDVVMPGPGYKPPNDIHLVASDTANIGDSFDGVSFTRAIRKDSKKELMEFVRAYREVVVKEGIDFAPDGKDFVKIPAALYEEIRAIAEVAEDKISIVTPDKILTLNQEQLTRLRLGVADHIHKSHAIAAKLIDGVHKGLITSRGEIAKPETAQIASWRKRYA
jgi:hypothetical protein